MNTANHFITTGSGQHFYFCNSGPDIGFVE